jgi:iron(III) transport system substrate-binding protein
MLRPLFALVAALALLAAACGSDSNEASTATQATPAVTSQAAAPATSAPAAAATADPRTISGEVVVYTSRAESLFKPVVDAFTKEYPNIRVRSLSGDNAALATRILEERGRPQADVLVNSDSLTMMDMAAQGAFEPNPSRAVAAVPVRYRAEDGSWVSLTLRTRVIMYNTNLVKPEELPRSMLELTEAKWRNQVGSADSRNGAMMAQIVVMRRLLGEQRTEQWVKGLVDNGTKFFSGHTDVRKAVGSGELKLGLVNHYYYFLSKAEGAPVGIIYPDQAQGGMGLIYNSTNIGIVKNNPNKETTRLFVDWMLSPTAQKLFAEANYEYPVTPNVALAAGVEPLDKFRLVDTPLIEMFRDLPAGRALAQKAGLP